MTAFPTLPSGAAFEAFPLSAEHDWAAIQDARDSGKVSTREKWSKPRRAWTLSAPHLTEADIHVIMGFIRDDLKGGATTFTYPNRHADIWNPGKAPTLGQSAGGALGARTYYVTYTFSDGTLETEDSIQTSYDVLANNYLTVQVPRFPTAVTSARLYVGTASGLVYRSGLISTSNATFTEDSASTTVNGDSNLGQPILLVAATVNFQIGCTVLINSGGPREEVKIIASIQAGVSLTMTANLTYTHTALQADPVATTMGNSAAGAPPAANNFAETLTLVLDETKPSPMPVFVAPGSYSLELYVLEPL